jgi:hypothetical protein
MGIIPAIVPNLAWSNADKLEDNQGWKTID